MSLHLLTRYGLGRAAGGDGPGGGSTAIASFTGTPSQNSSSEQAGIIVTFSQPVTAIGARCWLHSAGSETLRLFQVSPATLLASVEVAAVAGEWVEGMFSSPVELSADTQYYIGTRRTDASSRTWAQHNLGFFTFDPLVTFVESRNAATNSIPSTGSALSVRGLADIIFEA